jgi:endonuclease VIII
MPEGDTLRRLAAKISDRFAGHVIERSVMRDPRIATVDLRGRTLVDADAYGKHLFVRFDDGRTLHAHLLMTGSFEVGRPSSDSEWRRRVELWLDNGRLTGVAVPLLGMLATADEHEIIDHLGPDLCAVAGPPDIDAIVQRMLRDPSVPLTASMLDQRNAAGFGNVYVNDVPFIAGVNPAQPIGSIERLDAVVALGTALIRVNAERGPQNTTGRQMQTDRRWVHGSGTRPCPVCGTRMEHRSGDDTPWQRSITWCPVCQPLTVARTADLARARRLIALHPAVRQTYVPSA